MRVVGTLSAAVLATLITFGGGPVASSADDVPPAVRTFEPAVIGGGSTPNPGYVAGLLQNGVSDPRTAHFCGGSLISTTVVLTAAHCVDSLNPGDIDVAVGATHLSSITHDDRIGVAAIALHPAWVGGVVETDLALLLLTASVADAPIIPLETALTEPTLHRPLLAFGWGFTDADRTALFDGLQSAAVLALTDPATTAANGYATCLVVDPSDDFCVGGATTGICQGDSGGPVLGETSPGSAQYEVVGVASYGPVSQCMHPTLADAAQAVSPHLSWIDSILAGWAVPVSAPGAPRAASAAAADALAMVWWSPPTSDGGDANLSYTVTGSPAGSCITTSTSCKITGLANGTLHTFTVRASNRGGAGPMSAATNTVAPVGPPAVAVLSAVLVNCSGDVAHNFTDVEHSIASGDIGCIAELGVTTGTSPTTFSPHDLVTREQMAAFIARLYRALTGEACPAASTPFTDVAGSFAADDIACIHGLEVTTGTSPSTYSPRSPVNRGQMAVFIARLYRTITGDDCGPGPTPFTDVTPSFAAADIGCIFGLGVTTGTSPTTYAPDDHVTREQMAAFIARLYRTITN